MPMVQIVPTEDGEWTAEIGERSFIGSDVAQLLMHMGAVWDNLQMTVNWTGDCPKCNGNGYVVHLLPDGVNSPYYIQCDACMGMGSKEK